MSVLIDRKFRRPRVWSNRELQKFAHLFEGSVINVSGWQDADKEGRHYRDYFKNAVSYSISNYKSEARGFQGFANEFFLDLTSNVEEKYIGQYDVVFNHTTLEHIYEVTKAFANLCRLSADIVIVVVPFLQQMHTDYGDYWRFTPTTIKKLFEENNMELLYLSFNNDKHTSVYVFAIAAKNPQRWQGKIPRQYDITCQRDWLDGAENLVGCRAITNNFPYKVTKYLSRIIARSAPAVAKFFRA